MSENQHNDGQRIDDDALGSLPYLQFARQGVELHPIFFFFGHGPIGMQRQKRVQRAPSFWASWLISARRPKRSQFQDPSSALILYVSNLNVENTRVVDR